MRRLVFLLPFVVLQFIGCNGSPPAVAPSPSTSTSGMTPSAESLPLNTDPSMPHERSDGAVSDRGAAKTESSKSTPGATDEHQLHSLSRDRLTQKMVNSRNNALRKAQAKEMEAAYEAYRESGRAAEELMRRNSNLDPQQKSLIGNVFYDQACGLAMGGESAAAIEALERAIALGWNDLDHTGRDSDLESVRKLPDFIIKREKWEQMIAVKAAEAAAEELVNFKGFPFDFNLPDLDANPVKLADHKGKIVIVDIWGTWCPPCRAEIPSFVQLQSKYSDQGIQIIGLNYERAKTDEEGIELIRRFKQTNNMNYPCLIGDSATRDQVPQFRGYPTTLFLDRTGKVRMQLIGAHSYARLESIVTALLAEPVGSD